MSVAVTTAVNVAMTGRMAIQTIVQHFEEAGATERGKAITLPPTAPRSTVDRLIKDQILVPVEDDRFYVDRQAMVRVSRAQGKAVIAAVVGLVVVLSVVLIVLAVTA